MRLSLVRLFWLGLVLAVLAAGSAVSLKMLRPDAQASAPPAAPQAVPVSVATVERRDIATWNEFSGRLEAVERVEVRSRVAGAVQAIHFREGAIVKRGDLLVTIDRAPYAAEVDRAEAQVLSAQARVTLTRKELDRSRQLAELRTVPLRDLDQRTNAYSEAQAALRAAQAELQAARLDLGYTEVRAPVAGRVGRIEVTVGNLVSTGACAPVLTSLVSVNPIYASFDADEEIVLRALSALPPGRDARAQVERIPVQMETVVTNGTPLQGHLQLIDSRVDEASGTVRVRAVFENADGRLMPGQFARLRMGEARTEPALVISERAVGTDQDKKFVMVVDAGNKAAYREVTLGATVGNLRVVTRGLEAGERIVVNGLHRIRPGVLVAPEMVAMDTVVSAQARP